MLPLLAILCLWCSLELLVLRPWNTAKKSSGSPLTGYELCGYGCLGECVGCCFRSLLPDYLRTFVVLLSVGCFLRSLSPSSVATVNLARTSLLVFFTAVCRGAADCVVILPAPLAPFLPYILGVTVGLILQSHPAENPHGVLTVTKRENNQLPAGRLVSDEQQQPSSSSSSSSSLLPVRQRRRSSIMSAATSSDRTLPACYTPLTSARGRRTSLPLLSMNRHRVSHTDLHLVEEKIFRLLAHPPLSHFILL